ncbi:MAG: DcaP family trimeric outer membrane transporter [Rikenellaceae bacterium]
MKTFKLLVAALLISSSAMAQNYSRDRATTVYVMTESDGDQIYEFSNPEELKIHLRERDRRKKEVMKCAVDDYTVCEDDGFQSAMSPLLVIAQRENRYSFAVGGFINLRTSYDFNGISNSRDFIPYDISVPSTYATKQQFLMDATTSRLYFSGMANTRALGKVKIFVDADFRGGSSGSYTPRVRRGYVSFLGLTMGRDVTTFCDTKAAPMTVDFQGPNAYNFNFATVLRYQHTCANDRFTAAIALESPKVYGTYNDYFSEIPQRVPDIPMYMQYTFGEERNHHLRVSGVIRNMYMRDMTDSENKSLFGWGAQVSGHISIVHWIQIMFNGVYGKGITQYIQDLTGSGLDFTPQPNSATDIQATPMYAWQAAAQINFTDRVWSSAGYSTVCIDSENGGYYSVDEYKRGQYIFGNLFYSVTPRMQLACEYLWGSRENASNDKCHANRVSLMAQYNF